MRLSLLSLVLLLGACDRRTEVATAGTPAVGAEHIFRLGCGSCHTIPGIAGAHGKVGPSLQGLANHSYVAGQLPNQPLNLEHWIQHPHSIHPDTLMPELGVTDAQARDIASYLYSLN
jgi:cytochrome c